MSEWNSLLLTRFCRNWRSSVRPFRRGDSFSKECSRCWMPASARQSMTFRVSPAHLGSYLPNLDLLPCIIHLLLVASLAVMVE